MTLPGIIAYFSFAHAIIAFLWAFYCQLKLILTLKSAEHDAYDNGANYLEARGIAISKILHHERLAVLRKRWSIAVIWLVFAFVVMFVIFALTASWDAPLGSNSLD